MPVDRNEILSAKERMEMTKTLHRMLPQNKYFDNIPIKQIQDAFNDIGFDLLQEDGSSFEGFLVGEESHALIDLGRLQEDPDSPASPIKNNALRISWSRMPSGRYEIVAYLS